MKPPGSDRDAAKPAPRFDDPKAPSRPSAPGVAPARAPDPSVAHDFANLLTAIIGTADAALRREGLDPETSADFAQIREGARRGVALVRGLQYSAQRVPGRPDPIPVNASVRATSRLLAHRLGRDIALALDLEEPGGLVRIDPSQLDRVLLNLVANAGQAMAGRTAKRAPAGVSLGTATLRTGHRVLNQAEARVPDTIPSGDYVVIAVADTGPGIPPDQLRRVFEPGVTTRRRGGGSGLGLSSVRDIVRQCDGFLAVQSVEGHGTCFEIYLPRVDSAAVSPAGAGQSRTVLLVEDEPLVRRVAERMLRRMGWIVLQADSADAALALLDLDGCRCDLMISDIAMPGMDGVALAWRVRHARPGLPIILTSGYLDPENANELDRAAIVLLTKPYGQEELSRAVVRVIEGRDDGA